MTRRRFLSLAAAGSAAGMVGPALWSQLAAATPATGSRQSGSSTGRTLVLVTLYGGNDGLNTVIPYTDPAYASARGLLAIDPSTVLHLDDGFGLHPGMPRLAALWKSGHLAIVHGVGFADPNYSHFESMDIWQTANPKDPSGTGWLGRWLDRTNSSPLRAVSIGPSVPTVLAGDTVQAAAIPPGPIQLPGDPTEVALYRSLVAGSGTDPDLLR